MNSTPSTGLRCEPRQLIDDIPWRRANEVAPGLWIGSLDTARSLRFITDKGITAVLSVCNEFVPAEDPLLRLMHHRIRIEDAPTGVNLLAELPAACAFIHTVLSRGGKVLVHSVRGQNRAPAVVVAYLMQAMGLDVTNAAERVRKAHEPLWLTPSFHEQLVLFPLCGYMPGPGVPHYDIWRARCSRG